jgi:hypothetical protein
MQDFESSKLLVALLGSSSPILGPIWSQNGPQNGFKSGPKNAQKTVQKMNPKITPKMPVLDLEMVPKMGSKLPRDIDPSHLGHPSGARWPQDGPKMTQDAQDAPKMASRWPKIATRWAKMPPSSPRCPQDSSKMHRNGPKMAPKSLQNGLSCRSCKRSNTETRRSPRLEHWALILTSLEIH